MTNSHNSSKTYRSYRLPIIALGFHVLAIAPLVCVVNLDRPGLLIACTAYFVVFGFLLHAIESLFYFAKRIWTVRLFLGGLLTFICVGIVASLLIPRSIDEEVDLVTAIKTWWSAESHNAVFDIAYSSIAFMVNYCVIGSATWPFVRKYYENPDSLLGLRVPPGRVIIALQLGRGFLATIALIPLITGLGNHAPHVSTWGYLAVSLSVTFGIMPMVMAPKDWPLRLRILHGIEIIFFVALQSLAWWWFLAR